MNVWDLFGMVDCYPDDLYQIPREAAKLVRDANREKTQKEVSEMKLIDWSKPLYSKSDNQGMSDAQVIYMDTAHVSGLGRVHIVKRITSSNHTKFDGQVYISMVDEYGKGVGSNQFNFRVRNKAIKVTKWMVLDKYGRVLTMDRECKQDCRNWAVSVYSERYRIDISELKYIPYTYEM